MKFKLLKILMFFSFIGFNCYAADRSTQISLHNLILADEVEKVAQMLNEGIDVDMMFDNLPPDMQMPGNPSLLAMAALYNSLKVAELLISRGANVNLAWPVAGHNPLSSAVYRQNRDIVELLLRHGATIDSDDNNLTLAISDNEIGIVKLLFQYGTKISDKLEYYKKKFSRSAEMNSLLDEQRKKEEQEAAEAKKQQ